MGLYSGGLIIRRIFTSEIRGAYFREGLFLGGLIIGILWYIVSPLFHYLYKVSCNFSFHFKLTFYPVIFWEVMSDAAYTVIAFT